jgi:lysophospholipase L1-like esterase
MREAVLARAEPTAWSQIRKGLAATLVLFLLVECTLRVVFAARDSRVEAIPLPYVLGDDYGPVPPWVDGLRILEPDPSLLWRNRAGTHARYVDLFTPFRSEEDRGRLLRRFSPAIPRSLRDNPVWEVSINALGFRGPELAAEKPADVFRVLCLGDSWTFGANVGQEETYPRQLEARLQERYSGARLEVWNLGVLGYSSYQGRELLERRAIAWQPDLVVVAFGMNDGKVGGWHDADTGSEPQGVVPATADLLEASQGYKLLRYLALLAKYRPPTFGDEVRAAAEKPKMTDENVRELEPWMRVPPADYEKNVGAMIDLARDRGAGVILLDNEIAASAYSTILERISAARGVPLVESGRLLAEGRDEIERAMEDRLGLARAGSSGEADDEVEVVFRVFAGEAPVRKAIAITGDRPELGELAPNRLWMVDDGTGGDEKAGDRVWTRVARLPAGARVTYVYTNSGREGRWEGLDVPDVRAFTVPRGARRIVRPIEEFGTIFLRSDSWHPDAAGYRRIAGAVLGAVEASPSARDALRARSGG